MIHISSFIKENTTVQEKPRSDLSQKWNSGLIPQRKKKRRKKKESKPKRRVIYGWKLEFMKVRALGG